MIDAKDAVVWTNRETKEVMVKPRGQFAQSERGRQWGDPIGASYSDWHESNNTQRIQLMLETAIDLAMQGFPMDGILREFAKVREFRALGSQSYPMCRALTSALVGQCLEPNTMSFEELLVHYAKAEGPRPSTPE